MFLVFLDFAIRIMHRGSLNLSHAVALVLYELLAHAHARESSLLNNSSRVHTKGIHQAYGRWK